MPKKKKVTKSTTTIRDMYELNDSADDILVDIKTGALGQSSITNVTIEDPKLETSEAIAKELEGSFDQPKKIGANSDLDRKVLKISTLIKDLADDTDETFIDIRITGGAEEFHQRMQRAVSSQRAVVFYTATIKFFKVSN